MNLDESNRTTILIHYYRAMVMRADTWRIRMDTTTNWSIVSTAAIVPFALGDASTPHYTVLAASFLTVIFLLLEARRLTFYHLWQRRALILERMLIRPAVVSAPPDVSSSEELDRFEQELAPLLGTTIPSMSLFKAIARRLRRIYVYLFAAQMLAWLLKLSSHPAAPSSLSELVSRARVGVLPGVGMVTLSLLGFATAVVVALLQGGARSQSGDQQG